MKSATEGQFLEFFAKLLTGVDYKKIDFDKMQKLIKEPQLAANMFIAAINNPLIPALIIRGGGLTLDTFLQKGDQLIFYTNDGTLRVSRVSIQTADQGFKNIHFKTGANSFDDKRMTKLIKPKEILEACELLGLFFSLDARIVEYEHMPKDLVYVEFY